MLGINNLDHPGAHSQSRGVRSIIVHPRYNRAVVDYDISIVELDSEVRACCCTGSSISCNRTGLMRRVNVCRLRRRPLSDRCVFLSRASCLYPTPTVTSPAGVTWATGVSTHFTLWPYPNLRLNSLFVLAAQVGTHTSFNHSSTRVLFSSRRVGAFRLCRVLLSVFICWLKNIRLAALFESRKNEPSQRVSALVIQIHSEREWM